MTASSYDIPSHPHSVVTVEADDDDDDLVAIRHDQLVHHQDSAKKTQSHHHNSSSSEGKSTVSGAGAMSSGIGGGGGGVSGNMSTTTSSSNTTGGGARGGTRQNVGGIVTETRYATSLNTLDEPVSVTIMRDLSAIGAKIVLILYPAGSSSSKALLRDWDLWGPLVACLGLAVLLSINAPSDQSLSVFTGVFVIVWVGSVVVTLNARLLGGKVSLFQSLCVLGYCLFPIMVAAFIALFARWLIVRITVSALGWAWSVWGAMNFFNGTKLEDERALLAVYPLGLMYAILAYITMLS